MDLGKAIQFGQLVKAAYDVPANDLSNHAGQTVNAGLGANNTAYQVITSIFANDLATDISPLGAQIQVSIGLVLQSAAGDAVIAIRGTEGIFEWIHDAEFGLVPCPFLAGAGNTEDGFTDMYDLLVTGTAAGSPSVTRALATLPWKQPPTSLTICGHSLGGALATLLALDVAANNTSFKNPTAYTYASPRTGDRAFAKIYNQAVPNTFRIANRFDVVPNLPLPPFYEHVLGAFEISSIVPAIPPKFLVKFDLACEHVLASYLFLLSLLAAGTVLPLDPKCVP